MAVIGRLVPGAARYGRRCTEPVITQPRAPAVAGRPREQYATVAVITLAY
jgi:hypothetical protein